VEIVKGFETAKRLRRKIRKLLREEKERPVLLIIRTGENDAALLYEKSLRECFRRVDMEVRTVEVPEDTDRDTFFSLLRAANDSPENHGIIVLKPFPEGVTGRELGAYLSPGKDVDGLGYFLKKRERCSERAGSSGAAFLPGSAEAVFELLKDLSVPVKDRNVVVIGRSDTLGAPAAAEAILLGANVTLCGSKTPDLPGKLSGADLVISAAGVPGLIRGEWLRDGVVVMDAGLSRGEDGKMLGDCDRESAEGVKGLLTPPVGGIGSVTAAVIALHTAEAYLSSKKEMESCEIRILYLSDRIEKLRYIDGVSDWIDLRAAEDIELKKGEMRLIPLGVAMKLPKGYEAHVAARSSTYKNFGILQANAVGIIDEAYSGSGDQWFFPALAMRDTVIRVNDRICQFRIEKHQPGIRFREVTSLDEKNRGGFGTTGIR